MKIGRQCWTTASRLGKRHPANLNVLRDSFAAGTLMNATLFDRVQAAQPLRIAYVSFEFPADNAVGGIATYVQQASQLMVARGHDVEVFAASSRRAGTEVTNGVRVHWCRESEPSRFRDTVLPVFAARHQVEPFDAIEGPEYNADAACIKKTFPKLPLVVKMHSPSLLLARIDGVLPTDIGRRLRWIVRWFLTLIGKGGCSAGQRGERFCL